MALNNECVDNPIEIRDYSWIDEDGKIDEIAFCKAYVSSHPVKCVNDIFYGMDGVVSVIKDIKDVEEAMIRVYHYLCEQYGWKKLR